MLNYIEGLLEKKTKGTSSDILYTQWSAAKNYIFQVLDTVTHTFPHYSMHDKTHADTIIKNIVRILGRTTIEEQFTSIDIWLMLMAAYYHDCGMAVFSTEKIEAFKKDSEFVKHIAAIKEDCNSPLNEYAQYLEIIDNTLYHKNKELTVKSYEAAKFLLADFIRKDHSNRSATTIHSNSSLHLPGNPIPERLIYWLSEICRVHTYAFEEVMMLPFAENGYDDEDCHPRFIACLLRIGDLLDIDNNRVSEILLSTLGSIPYDSLIHRNKTASIRRIQINPKNISISAECDSYEVADISNKWFDWINEEFTNQIKNWNNIVPNSKYGYLPTIGELNVNLKNFDLFDGKSRPRFSINSQKAIELLQGTGLYNDPCQSIRELLQNATDATYLRLWKEHKVSLKNDFDEFKKLCLDSKIDIKLTFIEFDGFNYVWEIRITDQGIGMSKSDLQFLAKTGSSINNIEKIELIKDMPDWMRPSGVFGIGFQSIFLLTDQVILNTKKINRENNLHVILNNPTGKHEGTILIQTNCNEEVTCGTELIFKVKDSIMNSGLNGASGNIDNLYDFAINDNVPSIIKKIQNEIIKYSDYSLIPITLHFKDNKQILSSTIQNNNCGYSQFYEDLGLEIKLGNASIESEFSNLKLYYRNQPVSLKNFFIPFWKVNINILKSNADEILTLNRNEINNGYKECLIKNIRIAIIRELIRAYYNLEGNQQYFASMFIELNKEILFEESLESKYKPTWGNYEVNYKKGRSKTLYKISLIDLFSQYNEFYIEGYDWQRSIIFKNKKNKIVLEDVGFESDFYVFFYFILKESFKYIEFTSSGIKVSKDEANKIYISDFKEWFNCYKIKGNHARELMPCHPEFNKLAVEIPYWYDRTFSGINIPYPVMICPYIRKDNDKEFWDESLDLEYFVPEDLIELTFAKRIDKGVTKKEIKDLYNLFHHKYQEYAN